MWGPWKLCDLDEPGMWLQRALSNCYSCLDPNRNVCRQPRQLSYHQYLVGLHPLSWQANLLSIQAFLMTQDLRRARLVLWTEDPSALYTNETASFFDAFSQHITIKRFDYNKEVVGTPWEGDAFFGNGSVVRSFMPMPGAWSDIVRIMLLHKYGHFWMDNDVVLYRDVSHLLDTCYQFVTRWTNLHVMRMDPGSKLSHRAMQTALRMPLNHPNFTGEVLDKLCKPNGYIPAHPMYNNTDIYNTCLFRVLIRNNNTGPPDAVLYDFPLGWWDHDWSGCFASREAINDTHWRKMAGSTLAMHNRHPGNNLKSVNPLGPEAPPSPLRRAIKIVEEFFEQCSGPGCLPTDGMPLLAYEGFGNLSVLHSSKMRSLMQQKGGRLRT
uniref:Uncharacterized protein n=1 Tax=Tetradesmus obliquus TaxID=3088 RepID=A0A383VQR7_TETOB|eukprot:jgi/Sobl393_1/18222/SZX67868.1